MVDPTREAGSTLACAAGGPTPVAAVCVGGQLVVLGVAALCGLVNCVERAVDGAEQIVEDIGSLFEDEDEEQGGTQESRATRGAIADFCAALGLTIAACSGDAVDPAANDTTEVPLPDPPRRPVREDPPIELDEAGDGPDPDDEEKTNR
ncbi:MAG: hypothetical protein ABJP48_06990 [Erythrobacter sp.]